MSNYSPDTIETAVNLRLIDDALFRLAATDRAFCQEVLRTILGDDKIKVVRVEAQETITSLHREVTLDVLCEDEHGRLFNVEVQKGNREDDIKRCRFHAATVTAAKTPKGTNFKDVPNVTVIYLSDYDALGYGKTLVKVKRFAIVDDRKEPFEDGEAIYYVNTVIKDGSRVSELMNLFTQRDAVQDDRFPATAGIINYYKNTGKGRDAMCDAVENYANEKVKRSRVQLLWEMVVNGEVTKKVAVTRSGLSADEFDTIAATLATASN